MAERPDLLAGEILLAAVALPAGQTADLPVAEILLGLAAHLAKSRLAVESSALEREQRQMARLLGRPAVEKRRAGHPQAP
jgi:hypothetical protein